MVHVPKNPGPRERPLIGIYQNPVMTAVQKLHEMVRIIQTMRPSGASAAPSRRTFINEATDELETRAIEEVREMAAQLRSTKPD
jgi:hypothetical protein